MLYANKAYNQGLIYHRVERSQICKRACKQKSETLAAFCSSAELVD